MSTWKLWSMKTFPGIGSNGRKLERFLLKLFFLQLKSSCHQWTKLWGCWKLFPQSHQLSPLHSIYKLCLFVHCFWCTEEARDGQKHGKPMCHLFLLWIICSDEQRQWVPKCHISVKNWTSSSWSLSHFQDAISERFFFYYTSKEFEKNHNALCFRMNSQQ